MEPILRQARRDDISGMHRVRMAVRENRLLSGAITEDEYRAIIEDTGRGWVIDLDGNIVAFAAGDLPTANVWALFVDPEHEGRGYGKQLHDVMVEWMFSCGVERIWLSTDPGTRADRFYAEAGWKRAGLLPNGEMKFERTRE